MKDVHDKFHTQKDVKLTMSRDRDPSVHSSPRKQMTMGTKQRLSKRESVFFKPTEKHNKVLEELVLKVGTSSPEYAAKAEVQDKHHTLQLWRFVEASNHKVEVCRRHVRGGAERVRNDIP